jgi:hypothetical protein
MKPQMIETCASVIYEDEYDQHEFTVDVRVPYYQHSRDEIELDADCLEVISQYPDFVPPQKYGELKNQAIAEVKRDHRAKSLCDLIYDRSWER